MEVIKKKLTEFFRKPKKVKRYLKIEHALKPEKIWPRSGMKANIEFEGNSFVVLSSNMYDADLHLILQEYSASVEKISESKIKMIQLEKKGNSADSCIVEKVPRQTPTLKRSYSNYF